MLLYELVQDSYGIKILGYDLVALGVETVAPYISVVTYYELVGESVFEHVLVVIHVVVGEDHGLFALGDHEGVALHSGVAGVVGVLGPDVVDIDKNVIVVVEGLEYLVVLADGHHPVVNAFFLGVAVKGQFRICNDRVEEDVLHNAVILHKIVELVGDILGGGSAGGCEGGSGLVLVGQLIFGGRALSRSFAGGDFRGIVS